MPRCLAAARESGNDMAVVVAMGNFGSGSGEVRRYDIADRWLREAISYATERDLDGHRLYCLAWLARTRFEQGHWTEATDLVTEVLATRRMPNANRVALTVLGRLRARRGDPDPAAPLDQAWELAVQTGDLQRLWPVAAGRAEAAWLAGEPDAVEALVADSFELAVRLGHGWAIGELGYWLWRAGELAVAPAGVPEPYALQIAGRPGDAARAWEALGCPYEAAIALADTDEPDDLLAALDQLNRLGAWPAAELVSQRLRGLGVRRLPGRPATVHAGPSGPAHRPGDRDSRPAAGGAAQRRHRRPAAHLTEDRRPPRLGDPRQARRAVPARGRRVGPR